MGVSWIAAATRPVETLARPLLAGIFISGGIDSFRHPEPRARLAEPVIKEAQRRLSALPPEPAQLVRLNAVVHVVAGGLLAIGRLPRVAATALAVTLVPTTLGGHRFWEVADPAQRAQQRTHLLKNAAILGGLLLEASRPPRRLRKTQERRPARAARGSHAG